MKASVAVIKTSPASVINDYGRLMRMARYADFLPKENRTYVKVNLSWREWFPSASTEPWQLEGVLAALKEDGYDAGSLAIAESRSTGINARAAEAYNGLETAALRQKTDFVRLDDSKIQWVPFTPKSGLPAIWRNFGDEGIMVPEIFLGNNVVHLPTMKTHAAAGIAGAAMSALDALLDCRGWASDELAEILVDVLVLQKEACGGSFAVMDGTICGDGPGPRTLVPYEKNYIMAGADPVALDAVAAHMMGFDPMEIGHIRLASERGLGNGDINEIEIVGEDIEGVNFHFGGGKHTFMQPSDAYLEYFWYPFRGWRHVGRIAETAWGQLFQDYLPEGAELERQGKGKGPILAVSAAAALLGMSAFRRIARMARKSA